jgi:hypothetical protein
VAQEHTVFAGAAVVALLAAALSAVLLRGARTRGMGTASTLRALG